MIILPQQNSSLKCKNRNSGFQTGISKFCKK